MLGGVAVLLWGTRMVRTGVTRAFGAELRQWIGRFTHRRLSAAGIGLATACLLQSSTATAMITASFAGRDLIAPSAALAVMLGADVGTTLVAQFLSLDIAWLSPILLAAGVFTFLAAGGRRLRHLARISIGLGLMLLSIRLIIEGSAPLRNTESMAIVLAPMTNEPFLAVIVAALLTWAAHSSLAAVLLVMSLASTQAISVHLALTFVVGANIGGAIAPVAMTMGASPPERWVPIGNLLMRTLAGLACLGAIPYLQPYLALLDERSAHMVVNFHTAFNLALLAIFLPLVPQVAKLCQKLLPRTAAAEGEIAPRYLDVSSLETPTVALTGASRETLRMGDVVEQMLQDTIEVFRNNDDKLMRDIAERDDGVDRLHEAIKLYLTKLTREELESPESKRAIEILNFTTNLEHIGDIIDRNLMELASKKIKNKYTFSSEGFDELAGFHRRITNNLRLALNVFMSSDLDLARQLLKEKEEIRDLERQLSESHFARVGRGKSESIETSSLHLDVLRDLKRINSHLTSVAYPILEEADQLISTRLRTRESKP
ncbi:MAG: Na/Pi cotransporter family protein [Rhodovibrionaceae bacterium]|nr:Na/Pi cotransporter family protein [Rhodovibrionaceae bacterium]